MDAPPNLRARDAIANEDEDALRAALAAGADPNASVFVPAPYFIPLMVWCAAKGLSGMCTLLVAAGADVHARAGWLEADRRYERSALDAAILGDSHEHVVTDANVACVRILLEAGADPNTRIIINGRQELFIFPLHLAISKKSDKMVKLLIEHGAGLELRQADGATPLLHALAANEGKIVLMLLRAGAVPKALRRRNIRDENEALSDFIVDMINYGGWIPHVQRHRGILLGIISRFSIWNRLPHEVLGTILDFWSPPGGRRPWASELERETV